MEVLTKLFLRLKANQECDGQPPVATALGTDAPATPGTVTSAAPGTVTSATPGTVTSAAPGTVTSAAPGTATPAAPATVASSEPTKLPNLDFITNGSNEVNSCANGAAPPQDQLQFKSKVKDSSFVQQTALLFEVTRHKHNTLVFLATSVFLGLFVFTRMYTPTDQLRFGELTPPQLGGEWVLNDVADSAAQPNNLRLVVAQKNSDLVAKGTDEFGDFDLIGKLIPPNKIHLEKIHNNAQLHDTQIMDGELTLEYLPFYAHGGWTRAHAIDPSKTNLQAEGYWEANFYPTGSQPKFK